MKLYSIYKHLLVIAFLCIFFYAPLNAQAAPNAVATFHSIGLYWSPANGSTDNECEVLYRKKGDTSWRKALSLWFDMRNREYRGSIVNLSPNTDYQIKMSLRSTSDTVTIESSTWSENFSVGTTVELPESSSSTLKITTSGTPNAYRLYTFKPGKSATIDVNRNSDYCIVVDANYVIIRGLTLREAKNSIIYIIGNRHHVVIEENDMSLWGTGSSYQAGVRTAWSSGISNVVIQRNRIHNPWTDSNNWCEPSGGSHPYGAFAVAFCNTSGRHVVRYNSIYSTNGNFFEDGIGGSDVSETGSPTKDSDIYGNYLNNCWDDAIHTEGSNKNVRVWGNYIVNWHHAWGNAPVTDGPLYQFRNIITPRSVSSWCGYNRGGLKKTTQSQNGRSYVFHNTMLWNPNLTGDIQGVDTGLGSGGNGMVNVVSRNNILHVKSGKASIRYINNGGSCDYDLYNGSISVSEPNGIAGTPTYSPIPDYDIPNQTGGATSSLSTNSLGYDRGEVIPNFSDNFTGSAPDIGAHEYGSLPMEFGVNAYLESSQQTPMALIPPVNLRLIQ